MQQLLTERQRHAVELAGRLADDFATRATQHDRENTFPAENWPAMRDAGYLRLTVPEELGGFGADILEFFLAQERLAQGDGSTALAVNMHLSACAQLASGWRRTRGERAEDLLGRACAGEAVFASCTSEAGFSDGALRDCRTTAARVDGGFVLNGRKMFFTESDVATHFVTNAKLDHPNLGPHIVFFNGVPVASDGLSIERTWDTLGMRGTQSNDLLLEDVFVPAEALFHAYPVGHLDALTALNVFTWAVPSFGVVALGIAAGGFEAVRRLVLDRGRQDEPEVQHVIARIEILLESARSTLYRHAVDAVSHDVPSQLSVLEVYARGNLAKYVACDNAIEIMDRVMELAGGVGYHRRFPIERMYRDVRAGSIMPYNAPEARQLFAQVALGLEPSPVFGYEESIARAELVRG